MGGGPERHKEKSQILITLNEVSDGVLCPDISITLQERGSVDGR